MVGHECPCKVAAHKVSRRDSAGGGAIVQRGRAKLGRFEAGAMKRRGTTRLVRLVRKL